MQDKVVNNTPRKHKRLNLRLREDRISEFPEHIRHHILSFLPIRDVIQISVLSKTWHRTWTSFPIWDFSESLFGLIPSKLFQLRYSEIRERRASFLNFVEKSLVRQCHHHSSIQRIRMSMTMDAICNKLASRVEQLIGLALQFGVKEIDIEFGSTRCRYQASYLPQTLFSAKTLNILRLASCDFKPPLHRNTMIWPSLQELSLYSVNVGDNVIQNLIFCCPSVNKLSLARCSGLSELQLSGLTNLNVVEVLDDRYASRIHKIRIGLLCLETFDYRGQLSESHIYVTACKNLKVLKISSLNLTNGVCQNLVSKLPSLKILHLSGPCLKSVKISSQQLEMLRLSGLEEVIIDAPNLQSFRYAGSAFPPVFSMDRSSSVEVTFRICFCNFNSIGLYQLRKYLGQYLNQIKLLELEFRVQDFSDLPRHLNHMGIPALPPDIKNLRPMIIQNCLEYGVPTERMYRSIVDALLWLCHPESLSLISGRCLNNEFMKVLCTTLMQRVERHEGDDECCCASSRVKCWQHDFKGVDRIEHIDGNGVKRTLTCEALSQLLPTVALEETITFVLKWAA